MKTLAILLLVACGGAEAVPKPDGGELLMPGDGCACSDEHAKEDGLTCVQVCAPSGKAIAQIPDSCIATTKPCRWEIR